MFVVFFFQAEDGIRDAQESRGLGDVYKRQEDARPAQGAVAALAAVARGVGAVVIVTGRPVAAVLQLASLRDVPHLGRMFVLCHYVFERGDAETDEMVTPEVPAGVEQARQELPALLAATGATATGASVEDKEYSLCLLYTSPSPRDS